MTDVTDVIARPTTADRYPWGRALLLAAGAAVIFAVLPRFAPDPLRGGADVLVLGVVSGIVIGLTIRLGFRLGPVVALGSALGLVAGYAAAGDLDVFVAAIAVLIGVELVVFLTYLERTGAWHLADTRDLLKYGTGIFIISAVIGGVAALYATVSVTVPVDDFLNAWRSWVIDDLFGLVCITPAFLTFHRPSNWSWSRAGEWAIAAAFTLLSTWYVFFVVTPGDQGLLGWPYLSVLGSIWIAMRLGLQAVAPLVAVQFWLAVVGTVGGNGAMSASAVDVLDQLVAVEMFSVVMASVILSLAVLRDGRRASLRQVDEASTLLREVIDGSDSLVFAKSYTGPDAAEGRYVLVNRAWTHVTGVPEEATVGHSDRELWPGEIAAAFGEVDAQVLATNAPTQAEERNLDRSGHMRTYFSSKFPLRARDGTVWGVGGIASDVTDVMLAREREERQAQLLHAVFELSPTPAVRLSMGGAQGVKVEAANAAMCHLIGVPGGAVQDCDLLDHVHPDDAATALDVLAYASASLGRTEVPATRQRELRMRTEDGRTVWVLMSAAAVRGIDDKPEVVAQFEDFTARRAAEQALSDQAMRDAVTGLPNRRALRERMDAALKRLRRHPGMVTVLFCDLDHFKDVNDSLGHHVGDRLLVEVAERLSAALRPEDTIARLGGDEFVALGEGVTDPSDAVVMALRLQDKLSAPWVFGEQVFRPAMSIGIATTTESDVSVDEMLRRADLAMYRAKEGGRNRIEVYDRSVDEEVQQAVSIQHELRRAIDTDGLVLHYQPIVRLSDGLIVGMEALVRMKDAAGRVIPPSAFVPQAEATGLIIPMGAWVLQQALTDLRRLHADAHDTVLAVNVSPTQLREEGFAEYLLEQVAYAGVRPQCLAVEVTETALIHHPGARAASWLG